MESSGGPLDLQVSPFQVRGRFSIDFRCHFGGPGTSFSDANAVLDGDMSIPSFKMFPGLGLDGFVVVLGSPRT